METMSLGNEEDIKLDFEPTKAICRCCLTTDRKMYNAVLFESFFRDLAGINVTESDGLPQWLCYECSTLLQKSVRFKHKVMRAHTMLYEYLTRCAPVLCTLSFLATGSYQRIVGLSQHMVQRTTSRCIRQVVDALSHPAIIKKWIVFPSSPQQRAQIRIEFQRRFRLPGIVGCIDCTHVAIVRPSEDEHLFFNRKGYHSLNVQMFPIDAQDEELSKYATPHLSTANVLTIDIVGKGKAGYQQVLEHEKQVQTSVLDDIDIQMINKIEDEMVKEENGFSDYEDNITLEEFRSVATKITEDDIASLLQETEPLDIKEEPTVKRKKVKNKESKSKKKKRDVEPTLEDGEQITKSSIRKPIELDPTKIRVVTLNPEEQIKQREEESKAGLKFPFQCNLCHKGFNFESKLQNHMSKHSPSRGPYECKLCRMHLPTSYSFNVHSLIHNRRYECVACGRRMIDRASIIDHYRTQHEGFLTLFTCHLCGKVSNNNKTHRGHMRNHHSGARPKCDQCGKTFINKDSLVEHQQIHQGIKNYECSVCNKRFRTRTQIKHHQLTHSDVKDYYCVECDVRFKSAHSLRQHLQKSLKHRDKQSLKFPCVRCSALFPCARSLAAHASVQHDGVRAYVCVECGAALASRSSLSKHTHAVHRGQRPAPRHVCDTCGKAFRGKSVLTNHVRTHTGEKPFECTECGRRFTQRTAMRTHVKLVHMKLRRTAKVKPEVPIEAPSPKLEVFKPEPLLEPWRQPCDVFTFHVTAGP